MTSSDEWPIVYCHYGVSDYLPITLEQVKVSNPAKRCILIGDKVNRALACSLEWEHLDFYDLKSAKRDEFNARFRWIQGQCHQPLRGGQDWLRYVSERFFAIEELMRREGFESIWHFDSDTMILHDLKSYERKISEMNISCTTLCNDMCPSGYLGASMIFRFTQSMIDDYKDREFLETQQVEFDKLSPGYAFTEMRAFCRYREKNCIRTKHLSSLFGSSDIWFDDCICQDNGFELAWADKAGRRIKNLYRTSNGLCGRLRSGEEKVFATVNCSWVPVKVLEWIREASTGYPISTAYLADELAWEPAEALAIASKTTLKNLFLWLRKNLKHVISGSQ